VKGDLVALKGVKGKGRGSCRWDNTRKKKTKGELFKELSRRREGRERLLPRKYGEKKRIVYHKQRGGVFGGVCGGGEREQKRRN